MKHKPIDPDKIYNPTEIARDELIPGVTSYPTVRNRVMDDLALPKNKRLLNAIKVGEGKGRAYLITGANLLKYLESLK